jgi:hypothetical protein
VASQIYEKIEYALTCLERITYMHRSSFKSSLQSVHFLIVLNLDKQSPVQGKSLDLKSLIDFLIGGLE